MREVDRDDALSHDAPPVSGRPEHGGTTCPATVRFMRQHNIALGGTQLSDPRRTAARVIQCTRRAVRYTAVRLIHKGNRACQSLLPMSGVETVITQLGWAGATFRSTVRRARQCPCRKMTDQDLHSDFRRCDQGSLAVFV